MSRRRSGWVSLAVFGTAVAFGFATGAFATHRWYCWKYADYLINFYNGGTGNYYTYYQQEGKTDSNAWDPYTDVSLTQVTSSGRTDHLNCYNGNYGFNGWLGIAEIRRYTGCTIKEGRCRLNTSYLENAAYGYTTTNKKHVACQEIGHLFGLGHNQGSNTTCMNDLILSAPQPDTHDRDLVNSIY